MLKQTFNKVPFLSDVLVASLRRWLQVGLVQACFDICRQVHFVYFGDLEQAFCKYCSESPFLCMFFWFRERL